MIMRSILLNSIPSDFEIRLNQAGELYRKIQPLCVAQLENPSERTLKEIGSYLGSMANILRSTLNYAMWNFAQSELKDILPEKKFKALTWQHDFPITTSQEEFNKKLIIKHIAQHYNRIYTFLESIQPYHKDYEWLLYLRKISNDTTHTVITQVKDNRGGNVFSSSMQTHIFDSKNNPQFYTGNNKEGLKFERKLVPQGYEGKILFVLYPDGSNHTYLTPCFFEPYGMFVSREGEWVSFNVVDVGKERLSIDLIRFTRDIGHNVYQLLSDFYSAT